jgi:uncharacterized BrkB/YihY/UPF0761 family membrane protein
MLSLLVMMLDEELRRAESPTMTLLLLLRLLLLLSTFSFLLAEDEMDMLSSALDKELLRVFVRRLRQLAFLFFSLLLPLVLVLVLVLLGEAEDFCELLLLLLLSLVLPVLSSSPSVTLLPSSLRAENRSACETLSRAFVSRISIHSPLTEGFKNRAFNFDLKYATISRVIRIFSCLVAAVL